MISANTLTDYSMSATDELKHHIATLIAEEGITKVIETGSFLGQGTTKAVLNGMKLHGKPFEFISIECNPSYYKQAKQNNKDEKVLFINALSIPKRNIPINLSFDAPDHIVIDHTDQTREELYKQEIEFNVPEGMLSLAVEMKPELVILDSAGHIGLIEFKYLMSLLPTHGFYLVLDDTNHIKHYHTLELIKSRSDKFEVMWESDREHQSAIIKVHAN